VSACSTGDAARTDEVSAVDTALVDTALADTAAADSSATFAPPSPPLLAGEGEVRQYRLLLVNRLERPAYVFASAGAGRVALDTVPPSDSVFVDLEVRADEVLLEAEDETGSVVRSALVDLVEARLNRWEITKTGRVELTLRVSHRPLVGSRYRGYPRSQ